MEDLAPAKEDCEHTKWCQRCQAEDPVNEILLYNTLIQTCFIQGCCSEIALWFSWLE